MVERLLGIVYSARERAQMAGTLDEQIGSARARRAVDLVITEGYKTGNKPKIEIVRSARHCEPLLKDDALLMAVVTDVDLRLKVPKFGFEDVVPLADMIEEKFL